MGIIFVLTQIMLFVSFILIKKTDKKINILGFISLSIGLLFCYNAFVTYVLTFFTIPSTLPILSIINFTISVFFIVNICRKKEIQSFEFHKIDCLYIGILGLVVIGLAYFNFGFPFNIKYETGDPSVHYLTSEMFSETDSLLSAKKETDEVYGTLGFRKTVSYVNSGLIMECFDGVIESFNYYNIFIIFGTAVLFITAAAMYTTISNFATDWKLRLLAFIISVLYTIGYPLNSYLFGFEYLSMSLFIICLIFDMVYYFENKDLKIGYIIAMFGLLNFGLFHSYYMFVPFAYPALWIYFCVYSKKKDKKILTKRNIILLTTTLLIPFTLGFIYYMVPSIYGVIINSGINTDNIMKTSESLVSGGIATKGYIYVNLYSNALLLLPISIFVALMKTKENMFQLLCFAFCALFIELLVFGWMADKVSMYYLQKNYYALWFILFYLNYKGLVEIYKKHPKIVIELIVFYIILIVMNLAFVQNKIEPTVGNPYERITSVTEVYGVNKTILFSKPVDLYTDEIEIVKYFNDNISHEYKTEVVGNTEQCFWFYTLTRYINNKEGLYTNWGQRGLEEKYIALPKDILEADYIVYFNRAYSYSVLKEKVENARNAGEVIFENEAGGIIKCNY